MPFVDEAIVPFGNSYKQVFQCQFQLLNFTFDLFRRSPKASFCNLAIRKRNA
jgi:hypothetical protein